MTRIALQQQCNRGMPRQEYNSPGLHFVIVDHIFIVVIEYGQSIMHIITEGGEEVRKVREGLSAK